MSVGFDELAAACRTLFGRETTASPEFVRYLRLPGLKAAFRSLALQTHPDHALRSGLAAQVLEQRFKEIRSAYELLLPYVKGEKPIPDASWPTPVQRPVRADAPWEARNWRYSGPVPQRTLRFAEFLFYTRRIGWRDLISAVVWQSHHRPRLAEIALEKGCISAAEQCLIRENAHAQERWGETATRLRLITPQQLMLLLGAQRCYGCAIGRYFSSKGLFSEPELSWLANEQRRHNLPFAIARKTKYA